MDIGMLIIVLVIVIPGYFMVRRLSRTIYSDNQKMEEETEKRYGFERLEKEIIENAKAKELAEIAGRHKRVQKKIVGAVKKTDDRVVIKYRSRVKRGEIQNR